MIQHLPVLLREMKEMLAPVAGGIYVDATVGLGGHAEDILKMIGHSGSVIGIDRDEEALGKAGERLGDKRLILKRGKFSDMQNLLHSEGVQEVDGILLDLGVSMMQLKDESRGFSFHAHSRLDMRMDSAQELTAWDVVNRYPVKELSRILREYGEEHRAEKIARYISAYRSKKRIDTCSELAGIIARAVGRRGRIHPATKTFQALRIEVNGEMEELRHGLDASLKILKKKGRLCVITYHSLEDRIVKNFIRESERKGKLRALSKKPVRPGSEELRLNPSSRSAKLRGAERL